MDFDVILRIFQAVNPELVDALEIQRKCFAQEFDYKTEAANLRFTYDTVRPAFARLDVPQPYDAKHPSYPAELRDRGVPLATRRVLVMDACAGDTVTKFGQALLEGAAQAKGLTVEGFKKEMIARMEDPAYVDEFCKSAPSALAFELFRRRLQIGAALANVRVFLGNLVRSSRRPYVDPMIPPNAPKLIRFLFDVHGYELFEAGRFNADPHPGNIMYDPASGVVSLIDYGQLIDVSLQRVHFARLFLAIDGGDRETALEAFSRLDQAFVFKPTGLTNPPEEVFAVVKLHYGGSAGIAEGLRTFGFESLADAMGPKMSELFEIASFNAEYAMVQRLGFCLNGVGQNLGTLAGFPRQSCSRRRPPPSFGDGGCRERTTRRNPWRRRLPNRRGHASRVGKEKLGRRKRGARRRPRLPRRARPERRVPRRGHRPGEHRTRQAGC